METNAPTKTRSGAVFSPFDTLDVACSIVQFVKDAVACEIEREDEQEDDAEGWPLAYVPDLSPLSSPTTSPVSSRASSPIALSPLLDELPAVASHEVPQRPQSHQQAGYYKRRQRRRAKEDKKIRSSQSERYKEMNIIKSTFNARKLPVTQQGFIGKRFTVDAVHRDLQSYLDEGFRLVEWDGK